MRQKFLRYKHKSTQIMHCIYGILFFIGLLFFTSCESLFHEEEVTIGEIETLEDLEVAGHLPIHSSTMGIIQYIMKAI